MKILFLSFFLLAFNFVNAQGNLQFNQLLTFQGTLDVAVANGGICNFCSADSPQWIVPANKIWKIESISSPTATVSTCGKGVLLRNSISLNESIGVIYAKSGDVLKFRYNNGSCNGYGTYEYSISIIEFNIVP